MCKYVIVITVLDVDGHFDTTLYLPVGLIGAIMSVNTTVLHRNQLTG